jgi:hypothetical protein
VDSTSTTPGILATSSGTYSASVRVSTEPPRTAWLLALYALAIGAIATSTAQWLPGESSQLREA